MTNFGLLLIVLGWAYQTWFLFKGNKTVQPIFVGAYALGVLFLVLGASSDFISLDGLSFIIAAIALILVLKKK